MSQEALVFRGHVGGASAVWFGPDGSRLASGGLGGVVVWDVATGLELPPCLRAAPGIAAVTYSPDGLRLASVGSNHTIEFWDEKTGRDLHTPAAHTDLVMCLAFSSDGARLASVGRDGTAKVWEALTGRELLTVRGPSIAVAFSPDGARLAADGADNAVVVWDAMTGKELLSLAGHAEQVRCLAFSPNGGRLASGGADRTVKLWDLTTGQQLTTLSGHSRMVNAVAFSPDGTRLASAGHDMTVRVWDTATWREVLTLQGHTDRVDGLAFSPDGLQLASASFDGTVRLWDAAPLTSELRAQQAAGRAVRFFKDKELLKEDVVALIRGDPSLTEEERQRALSLAKRTSEDPNQLNAASWAVVLRPDAPADAYRKALRWAEAACRQEPDDGFYLNTLGVAQYRTGRYKEALETLGRSDKITSAFTGGSQPADLAFLAMAKHRLGQKGPAAVTLRSLREVMKQPSWSDDEEAQAFLREAQALIDGKPAPAAPAP
jgi:hypothetical protein